MPQVASDTRAHTLSHPLPHLHRPTEPPDRAPPSPFESLLDDSAQEVPEQPAQSQTAAAEKPSRDARPEPAQGSAKDGESKAAKTNDSAKSADTGKDAKTDTVPGDTKVTTVDKAIADLNSGEKPTEGDDKKQASEGMPTDCPMTADISSAVLTDTTKMTASANVIAAAVAFTPAPEPTSTPMPDGIQTAAPVANIGALVAVETPKLKPLDLTTLQSNTTKKQDETDTDSSSNAGSVLSADETKLSAKTAPQLQTDGKPQLVANDADKDPIAHARSELAANDHRAVTTDAPTTTGSDPSAAATKTTTDGMPQTTLTVPSHNSAARDINPAGTNASTSPGAAVPLAGVALEIAAKAFAGKNRFEIRLDPPELGRIEVRLDVDRDGNVTSRLIADRSDTLDLLRRDASGLERALQDAGLKTGGNSLQFSLRDQSLGQEQANSGSDTARLVVEDQTLHAIDATQRGYSRFAGQGSGIDIHV